MNLQSNDHSSWIVDGEWYWETYKDVRAAFFDPSLHYLQHGMKENRMPCPFFNAVWYRKKYGLPFSKMNALKHYLIFGFRLGFEPCAHFNDMVLNFKEHLLSQIVDAYGKEAHPSHFNPKHDLEAQVVRLSSPVPLPFSPEVNKYGLRFAEILWRWDPFRGQLHQQSPLEFIMRSKEYTAFKLVSLTFKDTKTLMEQRAQSVGLVSFLSSKASFDYDLIQPLTHQHKPCGKYDHCSLPLILSDNNQFKPKVAVVYILPVEEASIPYFQDWLYSYSQTNAGLMHDLVIVLVDLNREGQTQCEMRAKKIFPELENVASTCFLLTHNVRFIVHRKFEASESLAHYIQFTNDHIGVYKWALFMSKDTTICTNHWLAKFQRVMRIPNVGLVGVSGSHLKNLKRYAGTTTLLNPHIHTHCFAVKLQSLFDCNFDLDNNNNKLAQQQQEDYFMDLEESPTQSLTLQITSQPGAHKYGILHANGQLYEWKDWATCGASFCHNQEGLVGSSHSTESWRLSAHRTTYYFTT
jgi:hypothetical protein